MVRILPLQPNKHFIKKILNIKTYANPVSLNSHIFPNEIINFLNSVRMSSCLTVFAFFI